VLSCDSKDLTVNEYPGFFVAYNFMEIQTSVVAKLLTGMKTLILTKVAKRISFSLGELAKCIDSRNIKSALDKADDIGAGRYWEGSCAYRVKK
jgi:hypothetical protein